MSCKIIEKLAMTGIIGGRSYMWDRKDLKAKGKKSFIANYWQSIIVSLFIVILASVRSVNRMGEARTGEALTDFGYGRIGKLLEESSNGDLSFLTDSIATKVHATQGVFATILNETGNSGSFLLGIINGINDMAFNGHIGRGIIILIAAIVIFFMWLFFQNIIQVGRHRFFLETRIYPETKFGRIFFVYRIKRIGNVAKVMFMMYFFLALWSLTIVGLFIKYYSYRLAPVILAENPSISWKEALTVSKKMMHGNKLRTFILDLSFAGWMLLSMLTFGLVSVFYLHPYREAVNMELYLALREIELAGDEGSIRIFNDKYLTEKPVGRYYAGQVSTENNEYPMSLFSVPDRHKNQLHKLDYTRRYSLSNLIMLFFSLCFIGYLYEIFYALVVLGEFVNRGTMYGPWLPIYGCGGMLTLLLFKRWSEKPIVVFFCSMALCGIMEFFTSWFLETYLHKKWWDYSGFFLNIDGRVCLEQLIIFGLSCCLNIYLISPFLAGVYDKLPKKRAVIICLILFILFITDFIISLNDPNTAGLVHM